MNIEAGTKAVLDLLLGEGKAFGTMDAVLRVRLQRVLDLLLGADDLSQLSEFRSLNLKFFDAHYQVNVDAEKRMWFVVEHEDVLITFIGSTDHKRGKKR